MQFEAGAEPDPRLPDHVPDELVIEYGERARREVRASRTWRYPVAKRVRRAGGLARNGELWLLVLTIFGWSVVAAGGVGALIYATILFPWAAVYVVLPVAVLFLMSVVIAVMVTRRQALEAQGQRA